ncbi:YrrS family protein [Aliibacillus thermotolerans]|uniref:YrrS family protein n=1 Tax=Aliibacillus thermotolerans TaxID=1834418 RepID=A0ABW0UAS1_9BACI|nr:YrrS family protein [Aliibacillus thermotolerans]
MILEDKEELSRQEMRKRKQMNRLLNTAIVVVGGLILFFAVQLFFMNEEASIEEADDDRIEETERAPESPPETNEPNERENKEEEEDTDEKVGGPDLGEWEPVGTSQTGPFQHDFNRGSQNWKEMENALRYATAIPMEEMTIWRLENGGENIAIGTVSDASTHDQPYQVTMQFVENEGWQPIEVIQLDHNPYQ